MVTRLIFYYCNYNTLGHSATVFSLVKGLKKAFKTKVKIVVIEAGIKETKLFPFNEYSKFYFYPLIKNNPSAFSIGPAAILEKKLNFLKNITTDFKPDIFVTDYYPFSRHIGYQGFEHFLKYLKNKFGSTIVCSSPYLNWTDQLYATVRDYYDLVLLHFPKEFLSIAGKYMPKPGLRTLNRTLDSDHKKISFTGFIFDKKDGTISKKFVRNKLGLRNEKLIIVSRGGRSECEKLIPSTLWLAKEHRDWFFLISTGPSLNTQKFSKYARLAKPLRNVKLAKVIYPGFDDYLKAADLSINMAGYNTMAKLLYFQKRTVAIPIDNTDQLMNLSFASRFIPSRVTRKNDLEPRTLEKKIRQVLDMKVKLKHCPKSNWFKGIDSSVNLIGGLF